MLENNATELYSRKNEGIPVFALKNIRTLKNKIYKCMTSISKNKYIDKLDDIVNKCNNTYHSTIKMKSVDVKSSPCIDFDKKNNKKDPKFKFGNNNRILKCKYNLKKAMYLIGLRKFL